ncbi:MAG: hypothetical protein K8F91_08245, partial [Candidatus Obscuribacterales bacterium]|nr:hypothetical protein [Candidatus Obscuribacterales bacterium]
MELSSVCYHLSSSYENTISVMKIFNRLLLLIAVFLVCFAPVQAQGLPEAELKKLDIPGYFEPIKKVADLPESISKLYPPMASPGERYSAGCVRENGLPAMALTFALKSKDRIWLSTVQGGIALVPEVVLY